MRNWRRGTGVKGVWQRFRGVAPSALLALTAVGCGPGAIRTGPALVLPSGAPQSVCERAEWYEAAPARIKAEGATAGVLFTTHFRQEFNGLALFRPGSSDPEPLDDAWQKLAEPELQQLHEARIETVNAAHRHSLYWALGGLGGMAVGIGGAVAVSDSSKEGAAALGIGGLVIGIAGVVGALVTQPSGPDQLHADARRKLFIEGEDDFKAVGRGVERSNLRRRISCSR